MNGLWKGWRSWRFQKNSAVRHLINIAVVFATDCANMYLIGRNRTPLDKTWWHFVSILGVADDSDNNLQIQHRRVCAITRFRLPVLPSRPSRTVLRQKGQTYGLIVSVLTSTVLFAPVSIIRKWVSGNAFDDLEWRQYHFHCLCLSRNQSQLKILTYVLRLLWNWYSYHFARIQWTCIVSEPFDICNGVRHGGILSPCETVMSQKSHTFKNALLMFINISRSYRHE